jgi:hypothetical protein
MSSRMAAAKLGMQLMWRDLQEVPTIASWRRQNGRASIEVRRYLCGMTSPYEDDEPLLPEQTRDDDPRSWGEIDSDTDDDERILREVPPHHG